MLLLAVVLLLVVDCNKLCLKTPPRITASAMVRTTPYFILPMKRGGSKNSGKKKVSNNEWVPMSGKLIAFFCHRVGK